MQKFYFTVVMFLLGALSLTAQVAVNETNFPDSTFRDYVLSNFDVDGDSVLSPTEIDNTYTIDVSTLPVKSLKGIEYLTNAGSVFCNSCELTSLDLSADTLLNTLQCAYNKITSLVVPPSLIDLNCINNLLEHLDVSHCSGLLNLYCNNNKLSTLDISADTVLYVLNCANNNLACLDISATKIDGDLTTDDNTYIAQSDANGKFDLTTIPGFDVTHATIQKGGTLSGDTLTFNDLVVEYNYDCGSGFVRKFSLITNKNIPIDSVNFPDSGFRTYVLDQLDTDKDSLLSSSEVVKATYLDINFMNISSVKGIEYLRMLATVNASDNNLDSLDLSHNPNVQDVDIPFNSGLKSINVSACPKLSSLTFNECSIDSIDISNNHNLDYFLADNNNLRKVDFTGDSIATFISLSSNPIDSIDVSSCVALQTFYCDYTGVKHVDVTKNHALTSLYCGGDSISSIDVSQNPLLSILNLTGCRITSLDLSADTLLTTLYIDNDSIGSLDLSNQKLLRELYCSSSNLSSLDVSAAGSNLSILECNYNNLTKLDLSQNINLSRLLCDCNNLVALDLSADTVSIDAENFSCVGNVMEVKVDGAGKMDLSTLVPFGFNVDKASNWTGGSVTGNELTFASLNDSVTYDYNCAGNHTATFTLVPKVSTGVATVAGAQVKAFATGHVINITGTDAQANVWDVAGRAVYSGTDRQIYVASTGVYIVKVAGKTFKVVIK
jgi:hypothetical protein